MALRLLLALSLALAAMPLLLPTASANHCLVQPVNGPYGLQVAHFEFPRFLHPDCSPYLSVFVCAAHADANPNTPSASVSFDGCVEYPIISRE